MGRGGVGEGVWYPQYFVVILKCSVCSLHDSLVFWDRVPHPENVSISDETCDWRRFPLSLSFQLLPPFKNKSKGLRSNWMALSPRHTRVPIFSSLCFWGSELRINKKRHKCHNILLRAFWLKKGLKRYLILVECWLYLVTKSHFLMFSPKKMEYWVYCNNII